VFWEVTTIKGQLFEEKVHPQRKKIPATPMLYNKIYTRHERLPDAWHSTLSQKTGNCCCLYSTFLRPVMRASSVTHGWASNSAFNWRCQQRIGYIPVCDQFPLLSVSLFICAAAAAADKASRLASVYVSVVLRHARRQPAARWVLDCISRLLP